MEQDERAVVDPSERNMEQGGEAAAGAEEGEQEVVSVSGNTVHGVASESAKKQEVEQGPWPEPREAAAASGSIEKEDSEALENPIAIATPFEFRSAAAEATPPSSSFRPRSRGRKQAGLMRLTAAGDAEPAGSRASVLGASSSSAPATGTLEDVHSLADVDRGSGSAPGNDKMLERVCSAPGATVAIARASPPDSYRRVPSRIRKQYSPKRFVDAAAAPPEGHPPPLSASLDSALPSASSTGSVVFDGSASTSCSNRPPSRGRKQRRPEHFIPEEAEATASAKARRSDIVLDRFLSSHVHGSSASDSEWARNVMAEDAAGRNQRGGERFRIRGASRHDARGIHAALRISRLGASSGGPSSSITASAPASPPGEPNGKGRFYCVLAVLGASLALSVVSCVLFYIVGQRSEPGPSLEQQDK